MSVMSLYTRAQPYEQRGCPNLLTPPHSSLCPSVELGKHLFQFRLSYIVGELAL